MRGDFESIWVHAAPQLSHLDPLDVVYSRWVIETQRLLDSWLEDRHTRPHCSRVTTSRMPELRTAACQYGCKLQCLSNLVKDITNDGDLTAGIIELCLQI